MSYTLSNRMMYALSGIAALGLISMGMVISAWTQPPSQAIVTTPSAKAVPSGTTHPSPAPATGILAMTGTQQLWQAPVETLAGKTTTLAHGTHGTAVIVMASWCLYCGYEDRYVIPQMVKAFPQLTIDVVDVSPQGGIADPGPITPPFHGHDGTGGPLTPTGMLTTMEHYAKIYQIPSSVHVYVAPSATQSAWQVQSFPTWVFADGQGTITHVAAGAFTVAAMNSTVATGIAKP